MWNVYIRSLWVISWILYLRKLLRYIFKLTCLQCSCSGRWAHNIVQKLMDEGIFLAVKSRGAVLLKIPYWVACCLTSSSVIRTVRAEDALRRFADDIKSVGTVDMLEGKAGLLFRWTSKSSKNWPTGTPKMLCKDKCQLLHLEVTTLCISTSWALSSNCVVTLQKRTRGSLWTASWT